MQEWGRTMNLFDGRLGPDARTVSEPPPLPQSLLDLIGEYGMARTDGVSDVERLHRWLKLIKGIKAYAAGVKGDGNGEF
jgi:hypothetical protein